MSCPPPYFVLLPLTCMYFFPLQCLLVYWWGGHEGMYDFTCVCPYGWVQDKYSPIHMYLECHPIIINCHYYHHHLIITWYWVFLCTQGSPILLSLQATEAYVSSCLCLFTFRITYIWHHDWHLAWIHQYDLGLLVWQGLY